MSLQNSMSDEKDENQEQGVLYSSYVRVREYSQRWFERNS